MTLCSCCRPCPQSVFLGFRVQGVGFRGLGLRVCQRIVGNEAMGHGTITRFNVGTTAGTDSSIPYEALGGSHECPTHPFALVSSYFWAQGRATGRVLSREWGEMNPYTSPLSLRIVLLPPVPPSLLTSVLSTRKICRNEI